MDTPRMTEGGAFVVLVGPDGVGKTSVAQALSQRRTVRYFHFRPSLRGPWTPPEPGGTTAKDNAAAGIVSSVARLIVNVARFWIAYLARIVPARRAGTLVVGDRWAFGYLVRPTELRYQGPTWLARLALSVMPAPDAVVCLIAPPEVIHSRKQELSVDVIEQDLTAWRSVPAKRLIEVDATESPDRIAEGVLEALTAEGA